MAAPALRRILLFVTGRWRLTSAPAPPEIDVPMLVIQVDDDQVLLPETGGRLPGLVSDLQMASSTAAAWHPLAPCRPDKTVPCSSSWPDFEAARNQTEPIGGSGRIWGRSLR
jgi:hypothetical protein